MSDNNQEDNQTSERGSGTKGQSFESAGRRSSQESPALVEGGKLLGRSRGKGK